MKVLSSLKKRCEKCQFVKRRGLVYMICTDPNHKSRQAGLKKKKLKKRS